MLQKFSSEKFRCKDESEEDDEEAVIVPAKGKKAKKGGFALLNVDSDNDVDSEEKAELSEEEDVGRKTKGGKKGKEPKRQGSVEEEAPREPQGGKKSKKSKKKRNEDDEEDIEKLLAELQIEYAGGKPAGSSEGVADGESQAERKKKVAGKGRDHKLSFSKQIDEALDDDFNADNDVEEEMATVKTAAQKKKEKKERQKREAALAKQVPKEPEKVEEEAPVPEDPQGDEEEKTSKEDKKKKKKEKKEKAEAAEKAKEPEKGKKGPSKHLVAAMQERLKKLKEEEERAKQEEEERIRRLEEAEQQRQEALRQEQERKEKKKQKEKERKERLKAEGKLLSAKQKQEKARAQAMLEALKAQGVEVPEAGKRAPRPGTRVRTKKKDQVAADGEEKKESSPDEKPEEPEVEAKPEKEKTSEDDVKDAWDATSSEDESEEVKQEAKVESQVKGSASEEEESEEESDEEESDSEEDSDDDHRTDAERKREKARARIEKRRQEAEKKRTTDNLRAAVVCVLGHVDTGKTKILDKLRRTHVQDSEAGGITQQIGATNVPIDAIKEQTRFVRGASEMDFKLPGLLIIDTPGHESFSNLRSRGSSLCDIAILVVDIMHGLEPQTIESLNLLKARKTPFIVALNKIDRLYDWGTMGRKDVRDVIKGQPENTQIEFQKRAKEVITQFAEQGMNAALFYENPDVKSYVSLVPTSAITGEGMGNLLYLIVESCQNLLTRRLMYSEDLQATVLEVKAIPGLGTTIDAILINGKLREGVTMILAGTEGPIVTQIRSLLMPQPLKELRVKNAYIEYKEVVAAQGVKIAAKELEKAIAGLNMLVAQKPDEGLGTNQELNEHFDCREEVAKELKSALSSIKLSERGVYVQASTLGSLEALLEFLRTSKIPYMF
uniref:Tr-type G domain-containing protein n=1 Tax=Phlebotomus papatasi TaxID=29031 RepID=A0A1B0DGU4_PHLPP